MSFTQGITSALFVVLGKFYTPVAALAARWVMGKFYMWLEWFALLILTLASIAFGYLQSLGSGTDAGPKGAPVAAMVCVLVSAAVSALASLVTEKILKGEQVPFHMQKVRLDVGSIVSSLALLPVLGCIATRAQDIPWALRPYDHHSCPTDSVCWDLRAGGCGNPDCHCECTRGIFAGWNTPVLFWAVVINTAQGWLVGKVTQQFSVIHRAIADSFSLLAIYFICDPLFNGTSLSNACLNLVAFIVPVSTATFSVATSEMQKVFAAEAQLRGAEVNVASIELSGSDCEESDMSIGSPSRQPTSERSRSQSMSPCSPAISESMDAGSSIGTQGRIYRSPSDGYWM